LVTEGGEGGSVGAPGETGRRERAEKVRESEAWLTVRSIWPERARRRWRWAAELGGGENRGGKARHDGRPLWLYTAAREMTRRHTGWLGHVEVVTSGRGCAWKWPEGRRRWAASCPARFGEFTEVPLTLFFKLLQNFLKNLKISKYKSFSKREYLQLSCFDLFQILLRFWNLNLKLKGDIFWILVNSKLL
jgi:hypothetical protein